MHSAKEARAARPLPLASTPRVPSARDHLGALGALALTARLKRLTDGLLHEARGLYDELGLGIEPNWHLVFLLLEERGALTVTEITAALGVAHPSVVAMTTRMIERGLMKPHPNPDDGRSKRLRLTPKGRTKLAAAKPVWDASKKALEGLIAETGVDVLGIVGTLEAALDTRTYRERTLDALAEAP